jgi:YD repeat-containing protein
VGASTKTYTDVRGLTTHVKAAVSDVVAQCLYNGQSVPCACGADALDGQLYCTTAFEYDRAQRVTAIIDPFFNRTELEYDGLGRKIWMKDPDVGETFYEHGVHGVVAASDSKQSGPRLSRASYGRTLLYGYDLLGRVVVQDAPVRSGDGWVNGPDEDDEVTYYDGHGTDATCYACDASTGQCTLESASCDDGAHWAL